MTQPCSQCRGPRLWRILPFRVPDWHSSFGAPALPAATVHALDGDAPKRRNAACFELRICDSCGHTAWYARDLGAIRALARQLAEQGRDDVALVTSSE